jgi:hypothetical protein
LIDEKTEVEAFKDKLRWNDLYYHLAGWIGEMSIDVFSAMLVMNVPGWQTTRSSCW